VKEGYEGRRFTKAGIIILRGFLGGFSWICTGVEFCSREGLVQGAPVCWRFWARGPGYPYGILELGSCPSWQGGNTVWAELVVASSWARQQQEGQQDKRRVSIRPRYFKLRICFILL
jgi:hypothetical protein